MLLSYSLKNFKSFKNRKTFSLICSNHIVKKRYKDNFVAKNGVDVFKTAIIVGENAGGKTNFIQSLRYLKEFIFSIRDRQVVSAVNACFSDRNIDKGYRSLESSNEQEFSFDVLADDGVFYRYDLIIDKYGIKKECLYKSKKIKGTKVPVFIANRLKFSIHNKIVQTEYEMNIKGYSKLSSYITEVLKKPQNGLFVNTLSLLGIGEATVFANWFNEKLQVRSNRLPLDVIYMFEEESKEEGMIEKLKSKEYLEIFKLVDSSIENVKVDDKKPFADTLVVRKVNGSNVETSLKFDSSGVCQFFALAYEIYKVIYERKTIFADEVDSFLNPVLTSKVFSYINSFNETGQLILTTHNVNHLNFQTFMKDQMYIVTKDRRSLESTIYNLCIFKDLRYDSNQKIYEYYFKGLLGGVDNG